MSAPHETQEALTHLRAANRAVLALSRAVSVLADPQALAEVDVCRAALSRLYQRLEAQEPRAGAAPESS